MRCLISAVVMIFFLVAAGAEASEISETNGTSITLRRGGCLFGYCPSYEVTIYGDGTVVFLGQSQTIHKGEKRYQIAAQDVFLLHQFMEERDFWHLNDKYAVTWTDQIFIEVCLQQEARKKCVIDYSGLNAGMPKSVREIEDEIDRIAGTAILVGQE